jgi:hypothetical protein
MTPPTGCAELGPRGTGKSYFFSTGTDVPRESRGRVLAKQRTRVGMDQPAHCPAVVRISLAVVAAVELTATKPCFFLPPAPESDSDFRLARRVHKT